MHTCTCSCVIHVGIVWFINTPPPPRHLPCVPPHPLYAWSLFYSYLKCALKQQSEGSKWNTYVEGVYDVIFGAGFILVGTEMMYHSVIPIAGYGQYPKLMRQFQERGT